MVALHAVKKSGDGILQSFKKLLVVLLRFSILILLLKEQNKNRLILGLKRLQHTLNHLLYCTFLHTSTMLTGWTGT